MLCDAFIPALKSGRDEFNARFAQVRREHATLDAAAFSGFVQASIDPVIFAVNAVRSDAVFDVVSAAWDAALELVGQRLAGPQAKQPWIDRTWQKVLVAAATHVARAPHQLTVAMSNAAHQLATTDGARPEQWIGLMQRVAPLAEDVSAFLKAGQVAAWRSGLAHYRDGALRIAGELPAPVALAALDAPDENREKLCAALQRNPWHSPGSGDHRQPVAMRAGAFRGFGGLFTTPPLATSAHDQILIRSGDDCWMLTADAFGATFHRAGQDEFAAAPAPSPKLPAGIAPPADIGRITSAVRTSTTVAVTGSATHSVLLFPLPAA